MVVNRLRSARTVVAVYAQEGRAVEFIADRRKLKTSWLAKDFEAGEEAALRKAREAGLLR